MNKLFRWVYGWLDRKARTEHENDVAKARKLVIGLIQRGLDAKTEDQVIPGGDPTLVLVPMESLDEFAKKHNLPPYGKEKLT